MVIFMKKVVIGMSGGVDSSVAAYILIKQGYEVIGLFMKNWDSSTNNDVFGNPNATDSICTQEKDYQDAKEVCEKLNIPLYRVNFVKEYWDYVFKYFLDELNRGRTPNPDVMCNKYIKFDLFVKEAKKLNADYVATGHYARLINNKLYKALDNNKDQTYFLSMLKKEQLNNVIFPIGEMNKSEVRKIAKELDLNTAEKKDSTGICFIGERHFKDFLKNYLPNKRGDIVNIENNEVLGKHIGLMYYTIGQRRGLNIGGSKDCLYVVGKDLEKNILYVCYGDNNEYLYSDEALIENVSWINKYNIDECNAKFRYRQKDNHVKITYLENNEIIVKYDKLKAITPGQICVLYKEDECIGAGIIKEVRKNGSRLWYL